MTSSMRVSIAVVFLLIASIFTTGTQATVSCDTVFDDLAQCYLYAAQGGGNLGPCCDGIKQLSEQANTTSDHQGVCHCIKSLFASFVPPGYSQDFSELFKAIAALPGKCHITYNIDPAADCNSIQ